MWPKEILTQKYQASLCELLSGTASPGEPRDVRAMHLLWRLRAKYLYLEDTFKPAQSAPEMSLKCGMMRI